MSKVTDQEQKQRINVYKAYRLVMACYLYRLVIY
jgi:hypothetical protein